MHITLSEPSKIKLYHDFLHRSTRKYRGILKLFLFIFILIFSVSPAFGITYDAKEFDTLTEEADLILIAKCYGVSFEQNEQKIPSVFTLSRMRIEKMLKGLFYEPEIIIKTAGGVNKEGALIKISGTEDFIIKNEYLLFLKWHPEFNSYTPIGLNRGIFKIFQQKGQKYLFVKNKKKLLNNLKIEVLKLQ